LLHVLDGGQRLPVWEQWIAQYGPRSLDARPGLNFSTLDQAISAAIAGAGVVVVDEAMVVRELQSGELLRHNPLQVEGPFGYWFLVPARQSPVPERVTDFKQWLLAQAGMTPTFA
jgi:LysR family glycine cleavage system transcriptional activator